MDILRKPRTGGFLVQEFELEISFLVEEEKTAIMQARESNLITFKKKQKKNDASLRYTVGVKVIKSV